MRHMLQTGILGLAVLTAPMANATCTQADLAGTWASYSVGLDVKTDYWMYCVLKIDATGKFAPATSSCSVSSGLESTARGSFTVDNRTLCQFKGAIELTKGVAEDTIHHSTLAFDKHTVTGVGNFEGGGFSFSMVRIK